MKKFIALMLGLMFVTSAITITGCPPADDDDSSDDDDSAM
jgi:hypothetical protein